MGYGPVNVPGINAQILAWNDTDVWHGLSGHESAIATLANFIRQNRWDADAAIAALKASDTSFATTLQTELAALKAKETGFATDIAGLKATDATHTANITALQTVAEDAELHLVELAFAVGMNTIHTTQLERTLMEERYTVSLENTLEFPFNSTVNSPKSIALAKVRDNAEYSVEAEILSHEGPVGEIEVTGKAHNGFKLSYSGSGASVRLLVKVKGGMS